MSANVKTADLAITIVVTLLKAAGLGPEADRILDAIEGAKSCIGLIDDIKNEIVSDPNKDLIRSLFKTMEEEVRSIKADLKEQGLGKDEIESTADALIETTRLTVKQLAQDDDALLDAARLPDSFFKILVHRAEPLPDWCDDTIGKLYEQLLKRVSAEFIERAKDFDRFDKVALASLLRDNLSAKKQRNRIERGVQENRAINLETNRVVKEDRATGRETNQLVKELVQRHPYSIPSRLIFSSRPDVVAEDRFIGRREQEQLNSLIADPTRHRTVLWGMRGCGKTQLAASLAKQCEDADWNLVAWLNAVSHDTIQSDLVELAKELEIDTSDQPTAETIIRRLFNRLKSADPSDRLIVFDNVENIADLRGLLPSGKGLRVVATTTNNTGWGHQGWDTIKVGVFGRDESINYLLTVTKSDDHDAADTLARRLGDLPLALAQAAATALNEDWTLTQYLRRLETHRSEQVIHLNPGDEYPLDVYRALRMAIRGALNNLDEGTRRAARRQLGALALLAESGVPTHWLDPMSEEPNDAEFQDHDRAADEDAHNALTKLIHRSIVQQSADRATTMLHRLQAEVLRESWTNDEHDEAHAAATDLLGSVNIGKYPRNDTKARRQEALDLVGQLRSIGTQEHSRTLFEYPQITESLSHAFSHAIDLGLPYEALTLAVAVDALEVLLGPDHPDALASRNNLAGTYESVGRLIEAIALFERVLADSIRVLGEDHPNTLASHNNLAHAYHAGGRFTEAIALFERVLADSIRVLGEDHPNSLTSRNNLAGAYESEGRLAEAIALFERVLADSIRVLGKEHPDTLASCNNLAHAYHAECRFTEAIALYEQLLADSIRILGENHPDTLISRNNLAGAYRSAGRLDESITLYERVRADCTRVLEPDHPITTTVHENLEAARRALEQQEGQSLPE